MHVNTIGEQEIWFRYFFQSVLLSNKCQNNVYKVKNSLKRLLNAIFWLEF